ncbi:hypothetical protein FRC02_001616 [Tulasnella sp. 418]|nr:hypothetical protein FRC02_001616 [Tulasnella sp. 418]
MYYVPKVDMWSYIAFSLTLATNILVTALIAFKLWWMSRQFKLALPDQTQKFYHRVIMVIIESGALYSASVAVLLAVYANRMSGATFLALDVVPQIVGISPTLIIVQLHICNSRLHTNDKDLPISSLQWAPKSNRSTSASPPACSVRKPLPQHSKLPLEHSSLGLRPTSSNPDISTYRDQWISPAHEREKPRQCSET